MIHEDQRRHDALRRLISRGEGPHLEFKEGLGTDAVSGAINQKVVHAILKTVAAFLNTDGGTLLLGVSDTGQVRGLEPEFGLLGKKNADGFELKLRDILHSRLNPLPLSCITITFETLPEGTLCRVDVSRSARIVHLDKEVYVRDGNRTRKLDGRELTDWVSQRPERRRVRVLSWAAVIGALLALIVGYVLLRPPAAPPLKPPRRGVDEPLHPCALPTALPGSEEAKRAYVEGCQKTQQLDYPAARALFERAAEIEPQHPGIRLALAGTLSWLGYDERASKECQRAVDSSTDLSPEAALWVRGTCYQIDNEFEKAIKTYRTLWKLSPDNLECGLQLATVQTDVDDGKGANTTVGELRKLPRPARDDPRIDLVEAQAAELLDNIPQQKAAAESALRKSQSAHQRLLAAEAEYWLGLAYESLGETTKARSAFKHAKEAFDALGDRMGAALTQHEIAEMLEQQGDIEEALLVYQEVVRFYKQIGHTINLASVLNDIADVMTARGNVSGAIRAYDDALATARKVRDNTSAITALTRKGDLHVVNGNLDAAKEFYLEAIAIAQMINDKTQEADALDSLADLFIIRGDLSSANKTCQKVRAINEVIRGRRIKTESWGSFVRLLLETGRAAQAETLARDAAREFTKGRLLVSQAAAENLLALSLLAQGRPGEAQDAITRAAVPAQKSNDLHARLSLAITNARVRCVQGFSGEAERELINVLSETRKVGFFDLQLEATLALGNVQMRTGERQRARALLTELETNAKSHGFGLIAKKAANAGHRP